MKKIIVFSMAALLFGGIALTSCKKYEDGPAVTVLTKKMRLAGTWELEAYLENDVDKTADYRNYVIKSETYTVDKEGTWTMSGVTAIGNINFSSNGTWEFANDKEDLTIVTTSTNPTSTDTYHITRLTNKEFWYYTQDSNGDKQQYHMKSK